MRLTAIQGVHQPSQLLPERRTDRVEFDGLFALAPADGFGVRGGFFGGLGGEEGLEEVTFGGLHDALVGFDDEVFVFVDEEVGGVDYLWGWEGWGLDEKGGRGR